MPIFKNYVNWIIQSMSLLQKVFFRHKISKTQNFTKSIFKCFQAFVGFRVFVAF